MAVDLEDFIHQENHHHDHLCSGSLSVCTAFHIWHHTGKFYPSLSFRTCSPLDDCSSFWPKLISLSLLQIGRTIICYLLGLQGDPTSQSWRKSVLNIHWKDWCWSWNSSVLAAWWEELTHWKRPWCWKRLKTGGEGDNREGDGWMALLTQWYEFVNSGSWWWTGRPCVLQSMGLQGVGHDWTTNCFTFHSFTEVLKTS